MLLATELVLSSQVSTRDVSSPSPSNNIPRDQYKTTRNDCRVLNPIAMARVFVNVNDDRAAALMREHELIEQSFAYWCSISRTRTGLG